MDKISFWSPSLGEPGLTFGQKVRVKHKFEINLTYLKNKAKTKEEKRVVFKQ